MCRWSPAIAAAVHGDCYFLLKPVTPTHFSLPPHEASICVCVLTSMFRGRRQRRDSDFSTVLLSSFEKITEHYHTRLDVKGVRWCLRCLTESDYDADARVSPFLWLLSGARILRRRMSTWTVCVASTAGQPASSHQRECIRFDALVGLCGTEVSRPLLKH